MIYELFTPELVYRDTGSTEHASLKILPGLTALTFEKFIDLTAQRSHTERSTGILYSYNWEEMNKQDIR